MFPLSLNTHEILEVRLQFDTRRSRPLGFLKIKFKEVSPNNWKPTNHRSCLHTCLLFGPCTPRHFPKINIFLFSSFTSIRLNTPNWVLPLTPFHLEAWNEVSNAILKFQLLTLQINPEMNVPPKFFLEVPFCYTVFLETKFGNNILFNYWYRELIKLILTRPS